LENIINKDLKERYFKMLIGFLNLLKGTGEGLLKIWDFDVALHTRLLKDRTF
jgi:hypothetical protein